MNQGTRRTQREIFQLGLDELHRIYDENSRAGADRLQLAQDYKFIVIYEHINGFDRAILYSQYRDHLLMHAARIQREGFPVNILQVFVLKRYLNSVLLDGTSANDFSINECVRIIHHRKVVELISAAEDAKLPANVTCHTQNRVRPDGQQSQFNGCHYITINDVRITPNEWRTDETNQVPLAAAMNITRHAVNVPMGNCFVCGRAGQLRTKCPFGHMSTFAILKIRYNHNVVGIIDPLAAAQALVPRGKTRVVYPVLLDRSKIPLRWTKAKITNLQDFLEVLMLNNERDKLFDFGLTETAAAARALKVTTGVLQDIWLTLGHRHWNSDEVKEESFEEEEERSDEEEVESEDERTIG